MKRSQRGILVAFVVVLMLTCLPSFAGINLSHASRAFAPNRSAPLNPYGLVDLDGFSPGSFSHCRWGVYQDEFPFLPIDAYAYLDYGSLTTQPQKELFVSTTLSPPTDGNLLDYANPNWNTPGVVWFPGLPWNIYYLLRKLHFQIQGALMDTAGSGALDGETDNLVILIHGWNPDSNPNAYSAQISGNWFDDLSASLKVKLSGTNWALVQYHWEKDADTGENGLEGALGWTLYTNGVEAAETGHSHGQHLGELLATQAPNLKKVHFITHSAGTWVARSATRYLLNDPTPPQIQITLLDPFIPGDKEGTNTSLTTARINALSQPMNSGNQTVWRLENYYAHDESDAIHDATSGEFQWRTFDRQHRIDWFGLVAHYNDHDSPVKFYNDSITGSIDAPPGLESSWDDYGWTNSMFMNEPVFTGAPLAFQSDTLTPGTTRTLSTNAVTRDGPFSGSVEWKWFKRTASGPQEIPNATSNSYTITSASVGDAGFYSVEVTYNGLTTRSEEAMISVAGGPPVILQAPPNRTVQQTQSTTFQVSAGGQQPLFYQWIEGDSDIEGATGASFTLPTTTLADSGRQFKVRVSNNLDSVVSNPAVLTVTSGSAGDPNEPNDSSSTATPLVAGSPIQGYIGTTSDTDWFKVSVAEPGLIQFHLFNPAGLDYDLELYGPSATFIKGSYNAIGLDELITHSTSQTGTYWVRVYGYPQGNGSHDAGRPYVITHQFSPFSSGDGNFGSRSVNGGFWRQTFTLLNEQNVPIHLTGSPLVEITGPAATDFLVERPPSSTIPPGGSTSFTIVFRPSQTGSRTATLSVPTDSSLMGTFSVNLLGVGETRNVQIISTGNRESFPGSGIFNIFDDSGTIGSSVDFRNVKLNLTGDLLIRGDLRFSGSASIALNGYDLKVEGTLFLDRSMSLSTSASLLVSEHVLLSGGNLSLSEGLATVIGDLIQSGGMLDPNGGRLEVGGDYRIQGDSDGDGIPDGYSVGNLRMDTRGDYVLVKGDFVIDTTQRNGYSGYNGWVYYLNEGTLEVRGAFSQMSSAGAAADSFRPVANHRVLLSGGSPQTVSFEDPSSSYFNILELANPAGVNFSSSINVTTLTGTNSAVNLASPLLLEACNLTLTSGVTYSFPGVTHNNQTLNLNGRSVVVSGDYKLKGGTLNLNGGTLIVTGNLIQSGGMLDPNGGRLEVGGDYRIQGDSNGDGTPDGYSVGHLRMDTPGDYVLVKGDFVIDTTQRNGYSGYNGWVYYLNEGTLEVRGAFSQMSSAGAVADSFRPVANHRVLLSGGSPQTVSFEDPSSSYFNILELANPAGVNFSSSINVTTLTGTNSAVNLASPLLLEACNLTLATTRVFPDFDGEGVWSGISMWRMPSLIVAFMVVVVGYWLRQRTAGAARAQKKAHRGPWGGGARRASGTLGRYGWARRSVGGLGGLVDTEHFALHGGGGLLEEVDHGLDPGGVKVGGVLNRGGDAVEDGFEGGLFILRLGIVVRWVGITVLVAVGLAVLVALLGGGDGGGGSSRRGGGRGRRGGRWRGGLGFGEVRLGLGEFLGVGFGLGLGGGEFLGDLGGGDLGGFRFEFGGLAGVLLGLGLGIGFGLGDGLGLVLGGDRGFAILDGHAVLDQAVEVIADGGGVAGGEDGGELLRGELGVALAGEQGAGAVGDAEGEHFIEARFREVAREDDGLQDFGHLDGDVDGALRNPVAGLEDAIDGLALLELGGADVLDQLALLDKETTGGTDSTSEFISGFVHGVAGDLRKGEARRGLRGGGSRFWFACSHRGMVVCVGFSALAQGFIVKP